MRESEREPWVGYLEHDVLNKKTCTGARVYEVVIKVTHVDLLAIVKTRERDRYEVGFAGAGRLVSLARKVRDLVEMPNSKWRPDKYRKI